MVRFAFQRSIFFIIDDLNGTRGEEGKKKTASKPSRGNGTETSRATFRNQGLVNHRKLERELSGVELDLFRLLLPINNGDIGNHEVVYGFIQSSTSELALVASLIRRRSL